VTTSPGRRRQPVPRQPAVRSRWWRGPAFCSRATGNMHDRVRPRACSYLDTRFLAEMELRVTAQLPEPLAATHDRPFSRHLRTAGPPSAGRSDSHLWSSSTVRGAGCGRTSSSRNFCDDRPRRHRLSLNFDSPTSSSQGGPHRADRRPAPRGPTAPMSFATAWRLPAGTFLDFSTSPISTATALPTS